MFQFNLTLVPSNSAWTIKYLQWWLECLGYIYSNSFLLTLQKKILSIYSTNEADSIELFIAAFSSTYDLAPPSPPPSPSLVSKLDRRHTGRLKTSGNLLTPREGERERGYGMSQVIWWRESLVLYKSWNTLWEEIRTVFDLDSSWLRAPSLQALTLVMHYISSKDEYRNFLNQHIFIHSNIYSCKIPGLYRYIFHECS